MKSSSDIAYLVGFTLLALVAVMLASWIGGIYDWPVQSLLSVEGIRWMLRHVDANLSPTPFLTIFILLIGLGLVLSSGLWEALSLYVRRLSHHKPLSQKRKRALLLALLSGVAYIVLVCIATFSPAAILLGVTGTLDRSPFIEGFWPLLSLLFAISGSVYGVASGQFHFFSDILKGMDYLLTRLGCYFIYLFFLSQLIGCLRYSQLDSCMGLNEEISVLVYNLLYWIPFLWLLFRRH